ncbi:DUF2232 domain-containing protein [Anaerovorax odorimutans]|uniref:DUF2232 domain-containing protein n=1 Tax=Anaerovorax odorimutans TaxID=109327 RepID=UPI0004298B84|nr:DUF2232 domain-containing protein [Anaerovorax odorimutans]
MYTFLILLIMIFVPIPIMIKFMIEKKNPYRGIFQGIISSILAIIFIFIVVKLQTGTNISNMFGLAFKEAFELQDSEKLLEILGLENYSEDDLLTFVDDMVNTMQMIIPSIIIIWTWVIAYLDYLIISKIILKSGVSVSVLQPIRYLTLPRNSLLGSVIIYLFAYISAYMGIIDKTLIMLNIQILIDFAFSIQGIAVVSYYLYMRRIPKVLTAIICVLLFFINFGRIILFILGITEVVFGIRKRLTQKRT